MHKLVERFLSLPQLLLSDIIPQKINGMYMLVPNRSEIGHVISGIARATCVPEYETCTDRDAALVT